MTELLTRAWATGGCGLIFGPLGRNARFKMLAASRPGRGFPRGGAPLGAVPTGLPTHFGSVFPTLKRGANEQCAYGAGDARGLGPCVPRSQNRDLGHPARDDNAKRWDCGFLPLARIPRSRSFAPLTPLTRGLKRAPLRMTVPCWGHGVYPARATRANTSREFGTQSLWGG
jgi:hypothetical protein